MRQRVVLGVATLAALLGGWPEVTQADPQSDSLGPRALAVGEALRAAAAGSASTTLNPAGAALVRNYVIEATVGLRPKDDATLASGAICDSMTSRVAACLYYDYVGSKPAEGARSRHEFGLTLAFPIADRLLIGTTNKYVSYSETVPEGAQNRSRSGYLLDAGVILRASSMFNLAFVGYNLVGNDDRESPLGLGGGVSLALGKLMATGDARWNFATDKGRFGGGIEYFLAPGMAQQGFPLRAGYVYDQDTRASFITAGVGYVTSRIAFDAGMRRQVSGGSEQMFLFGLRLFLPN